MNIADLDRDFLLMMRDRSLAITDALELVRHFRKGAVEAAVRPIITAAKEVAQTEPGRTTLLVHTSS